MQASRTFRRGSVATNTMTTLSYRRRCDHSRSRECFRSHLLMISKPRFSPIRACQRLRRAAATQGSRLEDLEWHGPRGSNHTRTQALKSRALSCNLHMTWDFLVKDMCAPRPACKPQLRQHQHSWRPMVVRSTAKVNPYVSPLNNPRLAKSGRCAGRKFVPSCFSKRPSHVAQPKNWSRPG